MLELSEHAKQRCKERGISPFVVEMITSHGCHCWSHGAKKYFLDKAARKKVKHHLGSMIYRRVEDKLNVYILVSEDDMIITAAHRNQRISR